MKKTISILVFVVFALIMIFSSCEDDENETIISVHNSIESHNPGQDCMSCHKAGENGEGWFTIAGTVYTSANTVDFSSLNVKFYSEPNGSGSLVATVQVDKYGNFYTTENINFGKGLYTLVEDGSNTRHMVSSVTTGNCNSCHGNSTGKIWLVELSLASNKSYLPARFL